MILKINFDASFMPNSKISGISVIIKNGGDKLILKSSKRVSCKNSNEAELRALNKAIGYINDRQLKNLLPKKCHIKIYGDSQAVIEISKKQKKMKGVEIGLMSSFINGLKVLNKNNDVLFLWIERKNNMEADHEARAALSK